MTSDEDELTMVTMANNSTSDHLASDAKSISILSVLKQPEYMVLSVTVGILSLIGTAGNIPVLVVYFRRNDNKMSSTFIKILALIDLIVCTFIMPYTIVYELHMVQSDVVCRLFEFLRHFTVGASNTTLVAIAAERYFAVCHFAKRISVKNVNCGIVVVMTLSVIMAVPAVLVFALVTPNDVTDIVCRFPHAGNNTHFCHFTTSIVGPLPAYLYQSILMMSFFLSLLLIVIFYCIIYSKLWNRAKLKTLQTNRKRNYACEPRSETSGISYDRRIECDMYGEREGDSAGPGNNQLDQETPASAGTVVVKTKRLALHYRTGKMLFLCTIVNLVTWLPFWFDIFGLTHNLVLRYLFFIGHATNPIVYGIVNVHVRQSFVKLFYDCKSGISLLITRKVANAS